MTGAMIEQEIVFDNLISKQTGKKARGSNRLRSEPRWQLFFKGLPMQCWGESKKEIRKKAVKKLGEGWFSLLLKGYRIEKTASCI